MAVSISLTRTVTRGQEHSIHVMHILCDGNDGERTRAQASWRGIVRVSTS
jgi:hypothetical protein